MMDGPLRRALELFVGRSVAPVRSTRELADRSAPQVVVSLSPSHELKTLFKSKGYTHFHSFVAIPSHASPYFLLPNEHASRMLAAARIYQPHKWAPRITKQVLVRSMKVGWKGWWFPKILVASKNSLPLAVLVREVTGEAEPFFALSLGRQAAVRKLTVQVMRNRGEILGYLKLPLTSAATERVRNEAKVLERLSDFPELRQHIPHLLYAGNWCDGHVLFQSALEGERGPLAFNEVHKKFLQKLRDIHTVDAQVQTVIRRVSAKWEKAARNLGAEWEDLGQEALRRSAREMTGKTLRCGVMHGDFAPWNTRLVQKELLLFDWESADWASPIMWDIFHFQIQAAYFFRKVEGFQLPKGEVGDRISFMLFLLSSVCRFLEEENHEAILHHKKLLIGVFEGKQPWLRAQT